MTERHKGVLALLGALAGWSLSNLFIKHLIQHGYDPHTQNFYRYLFGSLAVLPFLVARARQRRVRLDRRLLQRLIWPTFPNLVHQVCLASALLWVYPALATFLGKTTVLFTPLLAFAMFPEERWLFRSPRFFTGVLLVVAGTVGLALLRGDLRDMQANLGVGLVVLAAAGWAVYSVSVKRVSAEVGPTVCFGVVSLYTTIALLGLAWGWGNLGHWWTVPWTVNVTLIISGIVCIGLGHTLYYYAMRVVGVSVCATMLLTTPLVTMLLSRWLFGEQLTAAQLVSGVVLLIGGAVTLLAEQPGVDQRS